MTVQEKMIALDPELMMRHVNADEGHIRRSKEKANKIKAARAAAFEKQVLENHIRKQEQAREEHEQKVNAELCGGHKPIVTSDKKMYAIIGAYAMFVAMVLSAGLSCFFL